MNILHDFTGLSALLCLAAVALILFTIYASPSERDR